MRLIVGLTLALALTGCSLAGSPKSKPTLVAARHPTATATTSVTAQPTQTRVPPTPVRLNPAYVQVVRSVCAALASRNAATIRGLLPYYQYNSGLRYGRLGDGEGQTGDPGLVDTWLASSAVKCRYFTPAVAGHGIVLAGTWNGPGPWAIVEMDTFNGVWKINDFTFGAFQPLMRAMHTARPVLTYRG